MNAYELLHLAARDHISNLIITSGCPVMVRREGVLAPLNFDRIAPPTADTLVRELFDLAPGQDYNVFLVKGDHSFPLSIDGVGRFSVSAFLQRGAPAAAVRVAPAALPDPKRLGLPHAVMDLCAKTHGLILVTGPAGSGKTTTLAAMIDRINEQRTCHIITVETSIGYLHRHKMSLVNQREVGTDTASVSSALHAALRQSPDVIFIGALDDLPTISAALNAAEAGCLVLTTLPVVGAAAAIDRVIDVFPPARQQQIRVQLSLTLQAVVSQRLLVGRKGGRVPVFEIMTATPAIRSMIRTCKTHQLDTSILTGQPHGMQLMDHAIAAALRRGDISRRTAFACCTQPEALERLV